jgi:hypothetical protein
MFNRITIDRPNNVADINLKGVSHFFSSFDKFKELTGFNFDDVVNVWYEPEREIKAIEKLGGNVLGGDEVFEINWLVSNIDNIIEAAYQDGYGQLPPGPTLSDTRMIKLYETDWMVIRHRDQIDAGIPTTLSDDQYQTLLSYRQQLRDITNTYDNLDDVIWPILDL